MINRQEDDETDGLEELQVQDCLLQGFQGLVLTFHVAAQSLATGHVAKGLLDEALASADQVLSDARARIERLDALRRGCSSDTSSLYKDADSDRY